MTEQRPTTKVTITAGGHTVTIDADEDLDVVAKKALELLNETEYGRDRQIGFDGRDA